MGKSKSMVIREHGGPEVMKWEETEVGPPGKGQLRVRIAAAGLNFIDVYHRTGLYPLSLPSGIGLEAAGTVAEAGADAGAMKEGDRVAFCTAGLGSYAEERLVDSDKVVGLPEDIGFDQAASMLLKGMTAEYLIRRTCAVQPGDAVVFYAAAGGVGQIACQWLKQLDAKVVGVVGSEEKAEIAGRLGCDLVLIQGRDDIPAKVREFTGGAGARVVYDSVGKTTFDSSIASLAARGMMVTFGNASGPVEPFSPAVLVAGGSLFLTRPSLMDYVKSPEELRASADALFDAHRGGVKVEIGQRYPLENAADAHRDLEARKTSGSTLLVP